MEETVRVMIHGLLHLCGYDDIQEKDRKIMLMKQELLVEQIIDRLQ